MIQENTRKEVHAVTRILIRDPSLCQLFPQGRPDKTGQTMELASLADAAPPGHQEFLNILANGSGAGCGKAAMIQTILLEQDFGQRYKAPLGAAEEQPCSSQANITFQYPLDIEAMFMSNPPSPTAAPVGDSDVAASASESTGPSQPTQRPRWLQEICDAETIDSHHQPPAKKLRPSTPIRAPTHNLAPSDASASASTPAFLEVPTFDWGVSWAKLSAPQQTAFLRCEAEPTLRAYGTPLDLENFEHRALFDSQVEGALSCAHSFQPLPPWGSFYEACEELTGKMVELKKVELITFGAGSAALAPQLSPVLKTLTYPLVTDMNTVHRSPPSPPRQTARPPALLCAHD